MWLRASLRISGLKDLRNDERGVTTVEYAVMLVIVAIAVILLTPDLRAAIVAVFTTITGELEDGLAAAPAP
jgi:Flp pilus assembly pilin Flp